MNILAKKMTSFGILRLQMVLGTLIMAVAVVVLPLGIAMEDVSLLLNPFVFGVILIGMLCFAAVGFFGFIRPCLIYRKLPEVLVESDGEFLYIHAQKEARIPLSELEGATVRMYLPHMFRNQFFQVLLTHLLSEEYGEVYLDVPGHKSYRLRFVAHVKQTAFGLSEFIYDATEKA